MEIDNMVLERINAYDYKDAVDEMVEKLKEELKEYDCNKKLYLNVNLNTNVCGNSDEEIVEIMSERIIEYRIKEKAYFKLMNEGIIYPVSTCDGTCFIHRQYIKPNQQSSGTITISRLVFNEFMVM